MSELTFRDVDAAKAEAAGELEARSSIPLGYKSGFYLEVGADLVNVDVQPGVMMVLGTMVRLASEYSIVQADWQCNRLASDTFYVYIDKDKKFYVYPTAPGWSAVRLAWYHTQYAYRYLGLFTTDANAKVDYIVNAGAVRASDIEADAITSRHITADSITASEISEGAVDTAELADDAVTTVKVSNLNITAGKIALDSIDATHINVPSAEKGPGAEDIVAAWDFTGKDIGQGAAASDVIIDVSGNGHSGTVVGAPNYVAGKAGPCLDFDGAADYITVADHADFDNLGSGDFSISCWVNREANDASANEMIFTRRDASLNGWFICRTSGELLRFKLKDGSGEKTVDADSTMTASTWYHMVAMRSSDVLYMYVDGVVQADTEAVSGWTEPTTGAWIGDDYDAPSNGWSGLIDQITIWSRALTVAEIQWLYHNPGTERPGGVRTSEITTAKVGALAITTDKIALLSVDTAQIATSAVDATKIDVPDFEKDPGEANLVAHWSFEDKPIGKSAAADDEIMDSGNGHSGTVVATPDYVAGVAGAALDFDGSTDYIAIADHADFDNLGSGNFSISCWVNRQGNSASANEMIFTRRDASLNGWLIYRTSGEQLRFKLKDGSGEKTVEADSAMTASTWYHMVAMRKSDVLYMYVDGVVQADTEAVSGWTEPTAGAWIGADYDAPNNGWSGLVDEIRIYSKALTAAEVQWLYHNPGATPLTGINRHRVGAAELTARHLRFGGADIVTEKGTQIVATDELWQMDFAGRSNLGRFPEQKDFLPVPDKLYDHDNTEYDNAYAKGWESDSWRTPVMGIWESGTNIVKDPEDLTTAKWTETNVTASLTEEYFDGKRWNKINVDSTSTAYIAQDVSISGSDNCVRVLIKKGNASSWNDDTRIAIYDVGGANNVGYVQIDWYTYSVTANDGATIYEEIWHKSQDIVEIAWKQGTGSISGTPAVRIYPNVREAVNDYVFATAVQVEENKWPTPYMPAERTRQGLWYRYTWPTTGAYIDFWMRPRFNYDCNDQDKYVFADQLSDTGAGAIRFFYEIGGDRFSFVVQGASNTVTLTAGCNDSGVWAAGNTFASNTYLHAWIHVELYYHATNTIELKINGVSIDTDTTDPGTLDRFNNILGIGSLPHHNTHSLSHYSFDGEIADFRIGTTSAGTHGTDDKPWVDGNSMPNFSNSVTLDRYGLKMNRGDLSILDKKHRFIDVGSQGIRAVTRSGQVVHDILEGSGLASLTYLGHLYLLIVDGWVADTDVLSTTSTATQGSITGTAQLTNVSSVITDEFVDARGLLVFMSIRCDLDNSKDGGSVRWYPGIGIYTSYSGSDVVQCPTDTNMPVRTSAGGSTPDTGPLVRVLVPAPIVWNEGTPFIRWYVTAYFEDMGAANAAWGCTGSLTSIEGVFG